MTRQSNKVTLIARVAAGQFGQAAPRFFPTFGRSAQGLVILQTQLPGRLAGTQRASIGACGGLGLSGLRLFARDAERGRAFSRLQHGFELGQTGWRRWQPRGTLVQLLGLCKAAGARLKQSQAHQPLRMARISPQQFLPGIAGKIIPSILLPIVRLPHQLAGRSIVSRPGVGQAKTQCKQQTDQFLHTNHILHVKVTPQSSRPSGANRKRWSIQPSEKSPRACS